MPGLGDLQGDLYMEKNAEAILPTVNTEWIVTVSY